MNNYNVFTNESCKPIKAWTKGLEIEPQAMKQLYNVSGMPFIFKHLAVMPDVHYGKGATVGSVIATQKAIIPAAVGVDIGCGMLAQRLDLTASDLPDNLHPLRLAIEAAVPHGRSDNGGDNDVGKFKEIPQRNAAYCDNSTLSEYLDLILEKHPRLSRWKDRWAYQLGTLGTGNHFIEVCLDDTQQVWIMLHSGSRGVGNAIGTYFIERAKEHMRRYFINLPDADLSYLPEDTQDFRDYLEAVSWAQEYALSNRYLMMEVVLEATSVTLGRHIVPVEEAVSCHHNYVSRENHFNQNVIVTRKGAVRARKGDLGIIPGSMGTGSFIVVGKGSADSFNSCSHGAGRSMSRGEANKLISLEEHAKAMTGIEARLDADVLDESPRAYKDINAVMAAQEDLVDIIHHLHQVLNVKG